MSCHVVCVAQRTEEHLKFILYKNYRFSEQVYGTVKNLISVFTLIPSFQGRNIIEIIDFHVKTRRWRTHPRRSLSSLKMSGRNYSPCKQSVFLSEVINYVNTCDTALVQGHGGEELMEICERTSENIFLGNCTLNIRRSVPKIPMRGIKSRKYRIVKIMLIFKTCNESKAIFLLIL